MKFSIDLSTGSVDTSLRKDLRLGVKDAMAGAMGCLMRDSRRWEDVLGREVELVQLGKRVELLVRRRQRGDLESIVCLQDLGLVIALASNVVCGV